MNPPPILRDPQLGLFEPKPTDANVVWLEGLLQQRTRWMLARDILEYMGRPDTEDQKRLIRALASASTKIISGQRGYIAIDHATPEEINHAVNNLIAQGKKLITRGIALRRNGHRILN